MNYELFFFDHLPRAICQGFTFEKGFTLLKHLVNCDNSLGADILNDSDSS